MTKELRVAASEAALRELFARSGVVLDNRALEGRLPLPQCGKLRKRANALYNQPRMSREDWRRAFAMDALADYSNGCRDPGESGRLQRRMPFVVFVCSRARDSDVPAVHAIGARLVALADKVERAAWPSALANAA